MRCPQGGRLLRARLVCHRYTIGCSSVSFSGKIHCALSDEARLAPPLGELSAKLTERALSVSLTAATLPEGEARDEVLMNNVPLYLMKQRQRQGGSVTVTYHSDTTD